MNPYARLSVTLLVSLGLWSQTAAAFLRGDVDAVTAAVRYGMAFVAAAVATAIISTLVAGYAHHEEPEPEPDHSPSPDSEHAAA